MLRYLRRVDDRTLGKLRWGILTNGRLWRLYFHSGTGTSENFLEIDLGKALQVAGCEPDLLDRAPDGFNEYQWRNHVLRLFVVLFRRSAFLRNAAGESFHQEALREGQRWEAKVAKTLSQKVFSDVFPTLADALVKADPLRKESANRSVSRRGTSRYAVPAVSPTFRVVCRGPQSAPRRQRPLRRNSVLRACGSISQGARQPELLTQRM